jgi:hypothetical protein
VCLLLKPHTILKSLLASRCARDHSRIKIDEGDDVTWIAATDEWLLTSQARVYGIARPLSPINTIFVGQTTRGITNEQCLARNLAAKSRAPLEIISLATQSPALNCWSSLDSVYTADDSISSRHQKTFCSRTLLSMVDSSLSSVWRSGSANLAYHDSRVHADRATDLSLSWPQ